TLPAGRSGEVVMINSKLHAAGGESLPAWPMRGDDRVTHGKASSAIARHYARYRRKLGRRTVAAPGFSSLWRKLMRPGVRSEGETSTPTRSPTPVRMRNLRILPDIYARITCSLSRVTR